jgi:CRISPR-associated exonuclease Cas4
VVPFHELAVAAYCPRQLYYRRRDDIEVPPRVERLRSLARRYPAVLDGASLPDAVAVDAETYRRRLREVRDRLDRWPELADPPETDALVEGSDCRGRVGKVLADPPVPVFVSPGEPPPEGVWEQQGVRAVAAAKALAAREAESVERAYVEYPAHARVRRVRLTTRRRAAYRRALRAVRALDDEGPPPRLSDRSKCEPCDYREECGVGTRSLRSLL